MAMRTPALPSATPPARVLSLLLLGLGAACSDAPTAPSAQDRVSAVVVTATRQLVSPGDTVLLTVQVMDSLGRVLLNEPVDWSSSAPGVARVDELGIVVADTLGAATITATAGGKSGSVRIEVQVSVLCDCTEILDSTAVTLLSRNDTTGTYVFQVIRGPPPLLEPGAIIVGGQGVGYIRRVQSSRLAGDLLTVETTEAYLEEAVRDGGFVTTAFTDAPEGDPRLGGAWVGPWTTTHTSQGVGLKEDGTCCSLDGLRISFQLGGKVARLDSAKVSGSLAFTVKEGSLDFSPRADVGARVRAFQLREFHSVFRGDLGLNIDKYELSVAIAGSKTFSPETLKTESHRFITQQRPYATFIGPMPVIVVFTKSLSLQITPTVSASAVFTGEFRTGIDVQAGVRWTDTGGWQPVASASPRLEASAPEFAGVRGSAKVRIAVVPEYNVLIYGLVGPFVNLEPYADAVASAALSFAAGSVTGFDWATGVSIGLNLNMGAKLSLLGRKDLFQVGFAIPLVQPRELVRAFSDGPLTVRSVTTGHDLPSSFGVRLRPAFDDVLPLFGVRDLSTSHRDEPIAPNGSLLLDDIRSGPGFPHELLLTDVAGNCYVENTNPDTVVVNSDLSIFSVDPGSIPPLLAPTDTVFRVDCIPLGDLRVRAVVTGPDAPPRHSVTLLRRDTLGVGRADTPDTLEIPGGPALGDTILEDFVPANPRRGGTGRLDATLNPGRRNCAVARPATNQLVIQSGDTVTTQYLLTCVALGSVKILTTTTDPDAGPPSDTTRYTPAVHPVAPEDRVDAPLDSVVAGDSAVIADLVPLYNASGAPGRYTVGLGNPPNRCTESRGFGREVTVFPGDTAAADFEVRCVERLHVITRTVGPGIDPDGYDVIIENGDGTADSVRMAMNDTVGMRGVIPGDRSIRLAGVEPSCTAPSPVTHTVPGRDSTQVTFQVDCPAPRPPTGLTASLVETDRVDLTWDAAPPDEPVALYRIYRDNVLIDSSPTPSYSDTGLPPNTSFVYQVSAVNRTGLEGARSEGLRVRTRDATPPTAPTELVATAVSGTQIRLTWQLAVDPETGIAGYVIYRDGAEPRSASAPPFVDSGLEPVTTYSYRVSAVNRDGLEGPLSLSATATTLDDTPPSAPTGLTATPVSSTRIDLAWSPAEDLESGIRGYNVFRDGSPLGTVTDTEFSDEGLAPSTTYRYTVTAVNGADLEGAPSEAAEATTLRDSTPPSAPTALNATPVSSNRIDLAWSAADDPESGVRLYRIYRDGSLVGSATGTGFSDAGLAPSTTYGYTVTAVNGADLEGAPSEAAEATTLPDDTPPTAPIGLTATAMSSTQVDLAWSPAADPESGVQSYNVYRNGSLVDNTVATGFSDLGLTSSTTYVYTVTAINGVNLEGPPSEAAEATTLPDDTPPTAPSGLKATAVSSTRIDLAWSPAADPESGIQSYNVYRNGSLVANTAATALRDEGVMPSTTYTYTVTAVNGDDLEGPPSEAARATTPGAAKGDVRVTTVSTGNNIPHGYEVGLLVGDESLIQPIEANGTASFTELLPGPYWVWLQHVPPHCVGDDVTPRQVTVQAGTTVDATFVVRCR